MISKNQPMEELSETIDTVDFHSELAETKKGIKEV